jgi:phosphatidylserine/phosphatidylglycerophosphate/cardiolipin synthase-like enzyme
MIKNILSDILGTSRRKRKRFLQVAGGFLAFSLILVQLSNLKGDIELDSEFYLPKKVVVRDDNFEAKVHFNDEMNTNVFSELLVKKITEAKDSIDLAMYSINMPKVKDALIKAQTRGVEVKLVLDESRAEQHRNLFGRNSVLDIDNVGGDIEGAGDYMHHKFLLIDKNTTAPTLLAGSFNYTEYQEKYDPSFMLETSDQDFINAFVEEDDLLNRDKRGYKKLREESYMPYNSEISYANGNMEVWFGPGFKSNSAKHRMIDLIETAEEEIKIIIWRITDDDVAKALYAKSLEGVKIKILTDDFYVWGEDSALKRLYDRSWQTGNDNIEIVSDFYRTLDLGDQIEEEEYFNPYLHQHTLIVDSESVLSGTNNWTYNGFYKNDEMIFISDVSSVVEGFVDSFDFHYEALKGVDLGMEFTDDVISFKEDVAGKKLILFKEESEVEEVPQACMEVLIDNSNSEIEISKDCQSDHTIFILLAKEDTLLSSGYLNWSE